VNINCNWVHTDEGFACNLTEVVARTLEDLDARQHMLIDDRVHVVLWSGQNGLPTFDGPNNYYVGNATFDEVHADAMMYFSADGSFLDFHIVYVPFDNLSPIPWTLIMISGIAVACIGLVVIRGRRQYR
jgi:hypothetical protein